MAGAQGKIPKTCPELPVFAGDVPYKRDASVRKAKSVIHNADRPVGMGILREAISCDYVLRPTTEGWPVAWQLIRVLAAERGMSRMVP